LAERPARPGIGVAAPQRKLIQEAAGPALPVDERAVAVECRHPDLGNGHALVPPRRLYREDGAMHESAEALPERRDRPASPFSVIVAAPCNRVSSQAGARLMSTTLEEAGARRSSLPSPDGRRPTTDQSSVAIPPLIRRNTILLALTQA